jgi:benzylsuccinate CoA-transferase BbsF subunit
MTINRGLQSVTINMDKLEGRELARKIVKECQVMLDNLSPRVLRQLGLDYDNIRHVNPEIIMVSLSGYGRTGPWAYYPAYGPMLSSYCGFAALIGYEDEDPVGDMIAYNDPVSAMTAVFAVMAALRYKARTGKGQYIDVSELECGVSLMGQEILDYTMNSRVASCRGNSSFWMAPHGCYRCKGEDKWITIACATEEEWQALCQATGNYQWLEDKRFVDIHFRLENRKELDKLIEQWTSGYTDYEAMEILQQAGVAAVPVFSIGNMFTDPHAQEEEYLVHLPHPEEPGSYVYNVPWKLSETPGGIRRHAPLMGEHNEYVLCELCGLPKEEFQRLVEEKVIW